MGFNSAFKGLTVSILINYGKIVYFANPRKMTGRRSNRNIISLQILDI